MSPTTSGSWLSKNEAGRLPSPRPIALKSSFTIPAESARGRMFFWGTQTCGESAGKSKSCDIGYALAISSCEGAIAWRHAPSQPFDAITAFAVPNPNCPSQGRRFFQVWLPVGLPFRADHSAYFGLAKFYLSQPFQPSTEANLESCSGIVNACFQCNRPIAMDQKSKMQLVESLSLNE